jgi:hypothetical protein
MLLLDEIGRILRPLPGNEPFKSSLKKSRKKKKRNLQGQEYFADVKDKIKHYYFTSCSIISTLINPQAKISLYLNPALLLTFILVCSGGKPTARSMEILHHVKVP